MIRFLLLAGATLGFAADLPRYQGFVNDVAGRLSVEDRDALEGRLRAYERDSTNEVVVAIVPSLDGERLEAYAQRLFRAWGIGKRDKNNGVLLLWAPAERKVRIQVGYGLEGTLSDAAAAEVVREITTRFRRDDWVGGLYAGVDGIIERLEGTGEPPKRKSAAWALGLPLAMMGGLIAVIVALWRRMRLRMLTDTLPRELAAAEKATGEAEAARRGAGPAFEQLKREAPAEVWQDLDGVSEWAAPLLTQHYQELHRIQSMPRGDLSEMEQANRALKRWNREFGEVRTRVEAADQRLEGYRSCKRQAPGLMREVGAALADRGGGWGWGRKAKMLQASEDTYERAQSLAASAEVNWLMVYDLLVDAKDCIECADNPGRYSRRERYWQDSEGYSPGYALLSMNTSSSSSDSGGYSGGDSGGGGGDCGGGGASGSY
jgi:uncharacterized protein